MRRVFPFALALILAAGVVLAGCGSQKTTEPEQQRAESGQQGDAEQAGTGSQQVELTVYFARYTDTGAWLVPVQRAMPYTQEVARAAVQELIKGPDAGSGLKAVIPSTVKIGSISIAGRVCYLDLSKEVLTDSASIGVSATTEGLLLSAIADTLTEFPTITKVKLTIEGKSEGLVDGRAVEDFWGHVGLPDILTRDETVIEPG